MFVAGGPTLSPGKDLVHVGEGLEFQRIAARVEKEHRRLLADLAPEADVRLDDELYTRPAQALGEFPPPIHTQDHAEVRHRHIVAVHRVVRGDAGAVGGEMRDDLVTVQIEVHPGIARSTLAAAEHAAVERPRRGEVVDRKREMEWSAHKYQWTGLTGLRRINKIKENLELIL